MGFMDWFVAEDAYLALAKIQGGLAQGSVTGTTYWVDSSNSDAVDAVGRGSFYAPFATIDYAIGQTTTLKGDVILVMPGHTETISTAAAIDLDVATTAVIGLGDGTNRPTVTLDAAAASIAIGAASCSLKNLQLVCSADAAAFISIEAAGDGAQVIGCSFRGDAAADEPDTVITIAAADDVVIAGNRFNFRSATLASTTGIVTTAATHRIAIASNYIGGNFTTAAISIATASGDIIIADNYIINTAADVAGGAITLVNSTTGILSDNRGHNGNATAIDPGDSCGCDENYFSSTITSSGTLDPGA